MDAEPVEMVRNAPIFLRLESTHLCCMGNLRDEKEKRHERQRRTRPLTAALRQKTALLVSNIMVYPTHRVSIHSRLATCHCDAVKVVDTELEEEVVEVVERQG